MSMVADDVLVGAIESEEGFPPSALNGNNQIKKCMSMLEMNEIVQVRDFEDAVRDLSTMETDVTTMKKTEESSENDFFFFDDDNDQRNDKEKASDIQEPEISSTRPMLGMRRSQSLASMSASSTYVKKPLRIDPIVEEAIPEDSEAKKCDENTLKAFDPSRRPSRSSMKKSSSMASLTTTSSADSMLEENETNAMKRNISFSKLEIREYAITLGDNPCVRRGPPVSLDWKYSDRGSMCLEEYESTRVPRRSRNKLVLSYGARQLRLIKEAGFTMNDLKEATKDVQRMKQKRKNTYALLPIAKVEEAVESAGRKMKRLIKSRS
uniref:Uncharacterized protein n=1 Tax=Ditylum brightwellii TaxID=49249 RepID=A0A7S4VQH3_9STRA